MQPDKNNLELILEIVRASEKAQIIAGLVIGFGILIFILKWLGTLIKDIRQALPVFESKKKAAEPKENEDEETQIIANALFRAQSEFIDDQRLLIKELIAARITVTREKSLDDTIPIRDELLTKLSEESQGENHD